VASTATNKAEKDHSDNLSLAGDGFDTVIKAKAAVDATPGCKNKVSCADILAMATRDVIALVRPSCSWSPFFFFLICSRAINVILMQSGGPSYPVELGRLDGLSSTAASVNGKLPQPTFSLNQLTAMFAANGLSQTDMIALSGMPIIIVIVLNSRAPITDILSWWVPKLDLSWPHLFIYINGAPFINQTHKQPFNLYSYLFFKNEMMHIIGHFFLFEDRSIFRWIYNFIELDFFFA